MSIFDYSFAIEEGDIGHQYLGLIGSDKFLCTGIKLKMALYYIPCYDRLVIMTTRDLDGRDVSCKPCHPERSGYDTGSWAQRERDRRPF